MYISTASGEGVSVDAANGHLIRCMLETSKTGFWSEKSLSQQKDKIQQGYFSPQNIFEEKLYDNKKSLMDYNMDMIIRLSSISRFFVPVPPQVI